MGNEFSADIMLSLLNRSLFSPMLSGELSAQYHDGYVQIVRTVDGVADSICDIHSTDIKRLMATASLLTDMQMVGSTLERLSGPREKRMRRLPFD
jgi:hypothetical protein